MITDASEFRKLVGVWGVTYLLDTNVVSELRKRRPDPRVTGCWRPPP